MLDAKLNAKLVRELILEISDSVSGLASGAIPNQSSLAKSNRRIGNGYRGCFSIGGAGGGGSFFLTSLLFVCRCKMLFKKMFGDGDDVDGPEPLISNATLFIRFD